MWSEKIANKLSASLELDNEKREIIAYGAFAFIHVVISLLLVSLIGWVLGILLESLIVSFSASILRQYSGGVHASKPSICLFVGTFATITIAIFSSLLAKTVDWKVLSLVFIVLYALSFLVIVKKAPVDTVAKPIKTIKKRKRMKRNSIIISLLYLVISVITIISYLQSGELKLLSFSACIIGALTWQAFTLTKIGHTVLNKLDSFINTHIGKEK